tara:strand:+ start:395 stop:667 length:273 start_codon:yes stop_codon:yes gene_type:complete
MNNTTKQTAERQGSQIMNEERENDSARFMRVEKCGVDSCPCCLPHETRQDVNFCHHPWRGGAKIGVVMGFPRSCPLQNANCAGTDASGKD